MKMTFLLRRVLLYVLLHGLGVGVGAPCSGKDSLVVGTVQSLSSTSYPDGTTRTLDTSMILQGYRFWAEYTNRAGGITLPGGCKLPVELLVYDDASDPTKLQQNLELLSGQNVDVFFGAADESIAQYASIGNRDSIISMACCSSSESHFVNQPWLWGVQVNSDWYTSEFLKTSARTLNYTRVAFVWHSVSGFTVSMCAAAANYSITEGMQVVYSKAYDKDKTDTSAYVRMLQEIAAARAEVLVGCTLQDDAVSWTKAMRDAGLLYGYKVAGKALDPSQIWSTSLKLMFLTVGPTRSNFVSLVGGFADRISSPLQWHHTQSFADKYFNSTKNINDLWKKRFDFGAGVDMNESTASAVAVGVIYQSAVESAANFSKAAIRQSLNGLDEETFFGRIKFNQNQRNIGHQPAVIQISCNGEICQNSAVLPNNSAASALVPYTEACAFGSFTNSQGLCVLCGNLPPTDVEFFSGSPSASFAFQANCPMYGGPPVSGVSDKKEVYVTVVCVVCALLGAVLCYKFFRRLDGYLLSVQLSCLIQSTQGKGERGALAWLKHTFFMGLWSRKKGNLLQEMDGALWPDEYHPGGSADFKAKQWHYPARDVLAQIEMALPGYMRAHYFIDEVLAYNVASVRLKVRRKHAEHEQPRCLKLYASRYNFSEERLVELSREGDVMIKIVSRLQESNPGLPFCGGYSHGVCAQGYAQHQPFMTRMHRWLGMKDASMYYIEMRLGARVMTQGQIGSCVYAYDTLEQAIVQRNNSVLHGATGVREQDVLNIAHSLAECLKLVHDNGVTHCALDADVIVITGEISGDNEARNGRAMIVDFADAQVDLQKANVLKHQRRGSTTERFQFTRSSSFPPPSSATQTHAHTHEHPEPEPFHFVRRSSSESVLTGSTKTSFHDAFMSGHTPRAPPEGSTPRVPPARRRSSTVNQKTGHLARTGSDSKAGRVTRTESESYARRKSSTNTTILKQFLGVSHEQDELSCKVLIGARPACMAPELLYYHRELGGKHPSNRPYGKDDDFIGSGGISPACDVYSLGVLMFRLVTGEYPVKPSEGSAKDAHATDMIGMTQKLHMAQQTDPNWCLDWGGVSVSEGFKRLVQGMLVVHPRKRIQNMFRVIGGMQMLLDNVPPYDFFISYRVKTDENLARRVYKTLTRMGLQGFLDKECLPPGEKWQDAFMDSLCRSLTFIPIVSFGVTNEIGKLNPPEYDLCDNVLLEYQLSLDFKAGKEVLQKIQPILVGSETTPHVGEVKEWKNFFAEMTERNTLQSLAKVPSDFVQFTARTFCIEKDLTCPRVKRTVRQTVEEILSHQGLILKYEDTLGNWMAWDKGFDGKHRDIFHELYTAIKATKDEYLRNQQGKVNRVPLGQHYTGWESLRRISAPIMLTSGAILFKSIDPDQTGFVEREKVCEVLGECGFSQEDIDTVLEMVEQGQTHVSMTEFLEIVDGLIRQAETKHRAMHAMQSSNKHNIFHSFLKRGGEVSKEDILSSVPGFDPVQARRSLLSVKGHANGSIKRINSIQRTDALRAGMFQGGITNPLSRQASDKILSAVATSSKNVLTSPPVIKEDHSQHSHNGTAASDSMTPQEYFNRRHKGREYSYSASEGFLGGSPLRDLGESQKSLFGGISPQDKQPDKERHHIPPYVSGRMRLQKFANEQSDQNGHVRAPASITADDEIGPQNKLPSQRTDITARVKRIELATRRNFEYIDDGYDWHKTFPVAHATTRRNGGRQHHVKKSPRTPRNDYESSSSDESADFSASGDISQLMEHDTSPTQHVRMEAPRAHPRSGLRRVKSVSAENDDQGFLPLSLKQRQNSLSGSNGNRHGSIVNIGTQDMVKISSDLGFDTDTILNPAIKTPGQRNQNGPLLPAGPDSRHGSADFS